MYNRAYMNNGANYAESKRDVALKYVFMFMLFSLFYNVIVTLVYGASGADTLSEAAAMQQQIAGGDSARQLTYISICALVIFLTFYGKPNRLFIPVSIPYMIACAWCLASFIWAIDPGIALRRSVGMLVVLIGVSACIYNLGARSTITVLYVFFAWLLIASFLSIGLSFIPLFSFAVHPATEGDPALIGAWKGVMMHKNVAGAIMVHSSIFFFHHAINRKKILDWLFFTLSIVFLLGTRSKMPLGWLVLVLTFGMVYRYLYMYRARLLFPIMNVIIIFIGCGAAYFMQDKLYAFFGDPESLTGRTQIWWSILPFIERNFYLGSGYGSFWSIGDKSPIYQLALTNFIASIGHSHSGYFEILLTTGSVGLVLAVIALIITPYYRFIKSEPSDVHMNAMLMSMWFFGLLQNMTESQFFSPDKQSWLIVVICITIPHCRHMYRILGGTAYLEKTSWPAKDVRKRAGNRINARVQAS